MSMIYKIILLLIFLFVIYYVYEYNKSEHLTIISSVFSTAGPNTTLTPEKDYFSEYLNKKIHLKCKIDSKYYYLVTISKKLFPELSSDLTSECSEAIVILMDSDKFNSKKIEYLQKNYKKKEFLGEFITKKYDDKYIFQSIDNENIDDTVKQTMLNQVLFTSYDVNKLCGDTTSYYPSSELHQYPEIELQNIENEYNIPSFKMSFITDIVRGGIVNGKKIFSKIYDAHDVAAKRRTYIGVSDETVKLDQDIFKRACLYWKTDAANSKNVLVFEPELVAKYT
jgi:hypothetical protein